ncbi:hypothetical protein, partial [Aeromicrobium sp. REDSEA-S38_B2]|uniref:hypothetical protein n=1 Tax=Aeromicrobium sp. REDSEA-S38_B2 TaxID=1811528 RepID=UPI00257FF7F8
MVKATLVSTLLGIGSELGLGGDSDLVRALRRGRDDEAAADTTTDETTADETSGADTSTSNGTSGGSTSGSSRGGRS